MHSSVMTVAPVVTPVSLTELKARVRYSGTDYDSTFTAYLAAAIQYCQEYQWAQYCTATYVDRFDRFTAPLELNRNPVISVTTVQYVDTAGATQTLVAGTDYTVDTYIKPCRIVPAYAKWWPATRTYLNDVIVTYQAGYGAAADVPDEIKHAILLKAAQQYESCDNNSVEDVIKAMLDKRSFRVFY